ncbi:MAG: CDP-diacylglycerol--serine O-phosphatidyltransferase [Cyclobacteriaceae bacterium]
MKKHIPNILTSLNIAIGSYGIFYVLTINADYAFYFVIIASIFDFLDGFAARLLKVKSKIGKELDSLADLISFGVLPAFYLLQILSQKSEFYWLAILVIIFSALRLAKFNLDDSQSDSFEGLPTPANAIMLTSLVFIQYSLSELTLIGICIMSCLLLVSKIRLLALKFESFSWKGNEPRWVLIALIVLLIIVFQWTIVPLLIPVYIIVSIVSTVLVRQH